jgi:heptosyltransferase-2
MRGFRFYKSLLLRPWAGRKGFTAAPRLSHVERFRPSIPQTDPVKFDRILIRATNWLGDSVMSLPAVQQIRTRFPQAHLAVLAHPRVAGLYRKLSSVDEVIPYSAPPRRRDWHARWKAVRELRRHRFDAAILLQNAFDAAALVWLAGIPVRIGYDRAGRGILLSHAIAMPKRGEIPVHQRYYYVELLRRAGLIQTLPDVPTIRLPGISALREAGEKRLNGARQHAPDQLWIGVAPGVANGKAKQWIPERLAETAAIAAKDMGAQVAVFGLASERDLCERVAGLIRRKRVSAESFADQTSFEEFLEMAAACTIFLANDSGAMHLASALDVPTVAVFGPTDPLATGPAGRHWAIVREPADCSPCLLHECPIDHRCMTAVTAGRAASALLELVQLARK